METAHSLGYWVLIALMTLGVVSSLILSVLYFFRKAGIRRSNLFFALLLATFGLTLLHHTLLLMGIFAGYPAWKFTPIYFTLSFPVLLFFYVKINCYPNYRLVRSDAKHFLLPFGQIMFFLLMFLQSATVQANTERSFFNPFYGALEHILYIIGFFSYCYFAYRYIRYARQQIGSPERSRRIRYQKILVVGLFALFCVHTTFLISDYLAYEWLQTNLRTSKWYAGLGVFSFVALTWYLCVYAVQTLIWGRRIYRKGI